MSIEEANRIAAAVMEFKLAPCRTMDAATEQEVDRFLNTAETAHPLQFPSWGVGNVRAVASSHWYFLGRQNGRTCFFGRGTLVPLFTRLVPGLRGLAVFRGPAWSSDCDLGLWMTKLVATARAHGLAYVDIAPDWIAASSERTVQQLKDEGWFVPTDGPTRMTLRIDLAPSEAQLFASFDATARNLIRRAAKEAVTVAVAQTQQDLEDFLSVHSETARRKGFESTDRPILQTLFADLRSGKKQGVVLLARSGGRVLGGAVVVCAGGRAEYMYGGNSRTAVGESTFKSFGYVLQWEAIKWAKSAGCGSYDLGGYSDDPGAKNARFKRRFSENVVRFAPSLRMVIRPNLYQLYRWRMRVRGS